MKRPFRRLVAVLALAVAVLFGSAAPAHAATWQCWLTNGIRYSGSSITNAGLATIYGNYGKTYTRTNSSAWSIVYCYGACVSDVRIDNVYVEKWDGAAWYQYAHPVVRCGPPRVL